MRTVGIVAAICALVASSASAQTQTLTLQAAIDRLVANVRSEDPDNIYTEPNGEHWLRVDSQEGDSDYYVNVRGTLRARINRTVAPQIWTLIIYANPHGRHRMRELRGYERYDCVNRTSQLLYSSGDYEDGSRNASPHTARPSPIIPGSSAEAVLDVVCSPE